MGKTSVLNDQYYTKQNIAIDCLKILKNKLLDYIEFENEIILEPSAGTGSFIEAANIVLKPKEILAIDIDPKHKIIKKKDFFEFETNKIVLTIGNPPFGKKSDLAIDFFNHASQYSHTIAFVVPVQFRKYGIQKKLNNCFKLIWDHTLPEAAFVNQEQSVQYNIRCCFQIWTCLKTKYDNLRLMETPPTAHPDFEMFQYNNTKETIKYFDYDWDFAVFRQGFYDYSLRFYHKQELNPKRQYIFFKTNNKTVLKILKSLNFEKIARKNTVIPGFGKADVIEEYNKCCLECGW